VRRGTQQALLVILGGALIRVASGDVYLRYVRPSHRWLLIGAGAVIVVLAVVAYLSDLRAPAAPRGGGHGGHELGDHGPGHRHTPWLLLVPVLAVALVAPPALGADAVTRVGAGNAVPAADLLPPLPAGDGVPLTVGEFVQRAVWDAGGTLDGRDVTLTGFAVRRGAAVDLARLTIVCCAADARASRVRLVGDLGGLGDVAPDTWLQVRGTLQPGSGTAATRHVPAMTVRSVEVVPEPADPYEY
jgi:uncharacterized repeat protein (TIGR03943 family)